MSKRAMLPFSAVAVPTKTRAAAIISFTSAIFPHPSTRVPSMWLRYASAQFSRLPSRMKSIPSAASLLQISSTARLVYDSTITFDASSNSSSFSV